MDVTRLDRTLCPSCRGSDLAAREPVRDHVSGMWFQVAACAGCGLVFLNDPPVAQELASFYDNPSGAVMHQSPPVVVQKARDFAMRAEIRRLARHVPPGAVIADIGAGDGSLVSVLQAHGFAPLAVDIFPAASWTRPDIPYAQYDPAAPLSDLLADTEGIEAVTMRHVLEHVMEPRDFLARLADIGVDTVAVIVPNIDSRLAKRQGTNWYYWDPPRHLTFFSPKTLQDTADRAGYDVAELDLGGLDEVVTALHRRELLAAKDRGGSGYSRLARITRPTGLLASASSAVAAPLGRATIRAVLKRR